MRRILPFLITLGLLSIAGCVDPAEEGQEADDDQGPQAGEDDRTPGDPRIPPLDDPGWEPLTTEGIPREIMPQAFQRLVFLQEPEAAESEHGGSGDQGFNLTQLNESIGPLHEGFVFNANRTFPPSWDLVFRDVNWDNRSVLFEHQVQHGDDYVVPDLPGVVTVVLFDNETGVAFRLDLEEGATFYVEPQGEMAQAGFTPGAYHVVSVEEDVIHLDHHPVEESGTSSHDHGDHGH